MDKKYKIDVHVLCWNEMALVPFVVDYWKRFARHVYVYDNHSTDGCVDELKKYDWIDVIPYGTDEFDDWQNKNIKDTCWKGSDADWVWVSDFDECLFSHHLWDEIDKLEENGVTLVTPKWIEVVSSTNLPEYEEGKLLHVLVDGGFVNAEGKKMLFFKPSQIKETNYDVGAHICRPSGNIKCANTLNIIHFKNLGLQHVMDRYAQYRPRMSKRNLVNGWGYQYNLEEKAHREFFDKNLKIISPVEDLLI